jgi:hypothetical protein
VNIQPLIKIQKIDTQQVDIQNKVTKETNNSRQNTTPLHEPTLNRGWTRVLWKLMILLH